MSSLVLITGASGHLGFRTLVLALEAGYRVIATIRDKNQAHKIATRPSIRPLADKLTFAVVKDITAPDAFDKAMRDVEYVLHIASPIASPAASDVNGEKPDYDAKFYSPARKGTLSLLETAAKTPTVRRVVITSSVVVLEAPDGKSVAGPHDIKSAPTDEEAAQVTDVFEAYTISKVIAHQAATSFAKDRKPDFDIIRVSPGYIQGANELNDKTSDLENGSNSAMTSTILGQILEGPKLTAQVLLEDVAKAHILALDRKIASNLDKFVILGNGGKGIPWDEVAALVERLFPDKVKAGILRPVKGQEDLMTQFDVSSSEQALGFKFAGAEEMAKSVVGQYLELVDA